MFKNIVLPAVFLALGTHSLAQNAHTLGGVARQLRHDKTNSAGTSSSSEAPHTESEAAVAGFVDAGAKANQNEAVRSYNGIAQLLKLEKFDVIEQVAHSARAGKTRFGGGGWELYTIYSGLSAPEERHQASDVDWSAHIERLQHWTSLYPNSITARVALASAYESHAWYARGGGYAGEVTDQGWKVFEESVNLAKLTLEEASKLTERCPHWYVVMQDVALDQGWDKPEVAALIQDAIALEPEYYYYYCEYVRYLLPKWHGNEGEAEKFADTVSSKIGGTQGRIAYFEIAALMAGAAGSNDTTLRNMSWDRIKQGYLAEVEQYRTSALKLNDFAYIAVVMHDAETARAAFEQIGKNWVDWVWKRENFEDGKAWAMKSAPSSNWTEVITSAIAKNMKTPEGQQYNAAVAKQFSEQFSIPVKFCSNSVQLPLVNFDWYVQLNDKGDVRRLFASPVPQFVDCLEDPLATAKFAPPPRPGYWVKINMQFAP